MDEDIVAIISMALLIGIPVVAISARIALKPVVEAIVRLRETFTAETAEFQARRIERLEAEVDHLHTQMDRLREAEEFRQRLSAPPVPSLAASDGAPTTAKQ